MRLEPRSNNTAGRAEDSPSSAPPRARFETSRRRACPPRRLATCPLLRFAVRPHHTAMGTVFLKFQPSRIVLLVLLRRVISLFALATGERHHFAIQFLCHGIPCLSKPLRSALAMLSNNFGNDAAAD